MTRTILRTDAPPRRLALALVVALSIVGPVAGCATDHASAPEEAEELEPVAGNGQTGIAGSVVDSPLVVRVRTTSGHPVPNVTVQWAASRGGAVDPALTQTDAAGVARTTWRLGLQADSGTQTVTASTPRIARQVSFTATVRPGTPPPQPPPEPPPPVGGFQPIALVTYDGRGQVVHPDVVTAALSGSVQQRWLAITPYPYNQAQYENPSVFAGDDGVRWGVPSGAVNPIVQPTVGYLSDPDHLWVPESGELWLYYRQVANENLILLVRSRDGVHWSAPLTVVHAPNHFAISPAVVRRGPRDWLMWTVNGGAEGCRAPTATIQLRRSSDGVIWSPPSAVALDQPGLYPWHVDVQWIESRQQFWALYNAKSAGSCNTTAAYLATSPDGVMWTTYPSPVLARTPATPFSDIIYRSTFEYDPLTDEITFWFSGARFDGTGFAWSAALQRRDRAELFAQIRAPAIASTMTAPAPAGVPLLDDRTAP